MRSEPAEAHLHFVRNANRASGANMMIGLAKVSLRKHNLPADARQSFRDKSRNAVSFSARAFQNLRDMSRIFRARVLILPSIQASIIVRQWRDVHPRLFPMPARPIELVRADVDQRIRVP